ncbi:hypothetical protein BFJ71_g1017 [Fusarium oxysporum]|nr:hypothetical protein BFJ71_g1017 [Fusarium oxysporum]
MTSHSEISEQEPAMSGLRSVAFTSSNPRNHHREANTIEYQWLESVVALTIMVNITPE